MQKLLLVDDGGGRNEVAITLVQRGYIVAVAPTLQNAWDKLTQLDFDWIVCHRLQEQGLVDALLESLQDPEADPPPCRMLLLTPAPAPIRSGTLRNIPVEIVEQPYVFDRVLSILDAPRAQTSVRSGPGQPLPLVKPEGHRLAPGVQPFIGNHSSVLRVIRQVEKVAGSDSTALLLGESGTGKELIAQSIHYRSRRSNKPLIPINCGAIPAELLESELFGHVKGAFSGATAARPGRFALADGGTLFLDEIGELPLNLQVKLLRALQEQEITPLGSAKVQKVDVRIIAATNQNLEDLVERRLFREDLYYRLNVIPIHLPPLRERAHDIPELVNFFLVSFNEKLGSNLRGFESSAMETLIHYPWPGNIRELKNFVERLAILNDGEVIRVSDLPEKIQKHHVPAEQPVDVTLPQDGLNFYEAVEQFEKSLIIQALDRTDWNKNKAASLLSMNRTTLVEKIKKKEISRQP